MGLFDDVGGAPPPPDQPPPPPPQTQWPPVAAPEQRRGLFDDVRTGAPMPAPPTVVNGVDWSKLNQPFGELRARDSQGATEDLKGALQDAILATGWKDPFYAKELAGGLVNTGSLLFPPAGAVLAAGDLGHDLGTGQYGRAAFDTLGVLPGVIAGRRAVQAVRGELPMARTAEQPTREINPLTGAADDELINSARAAYGRVARAPIDFHPNSIEDIANRTRWILQQPGGGSFTPQNAPGIYGTLDRWVTDMRARGTVITPNDLDTLRGQLRAFTEGPDSVAGQRAATILDTWLQFPPPGAVVRSAPGALDNVRRDLAQARGDYRAGKTAATVEQEIDRAGTKAGGANSGLNAENKTRAAMLGLTQSDAGLAKIPGATYPERQQLTGVGVGDWLTNKLRYISNRMGGGGGFTGTFGGGIAGHTINSLAGSWGVDPVTATALGAGAGYAWPKVGEAFRRASTARTVNAADEAVAAIRRNSPLYRAREAASPDILSPNSMARDAVAYAMIPQLRQQGLSVWDQAHVPYENRPDEEQQ